MSGRTESRQGSHPNDVSVAAFAWNAEVDAVIPVGQSWLYGEVPAGSIIFGGFVQVVEEVTGDLSFTIGSNAVLVYAIGGVVSPGWYPLDVSRFEDPTENFLVGIETEASRLLVTNAGTPVETGEFCIYLFYILDELGPFGQILHPLSIPLMVPPPPVLFGTPPMPVADIPSLVPPAPLPELPTPRAWYRRARYPRTTPIVP
jgi:hypothetical protein